MPFARFVRQFIHPEHFIQLLNTIGRAGFGVAHVCDPTAVRGTLSSSPQSTLDLHELKEQLVYSMDASTDDALNLQTTVTSHRYCSDTRGDFSAIIRVSTAA